MHRPLSTLLLQRVRSSLAHSHCCSLSSLAQPSSSSSSVRREFRGRSIDLSPIRASEIVGSTISRCSHLWEEKGEVFASCDLKGLLFRVFDISPRTVRRFLRASELKPEDVHEILLGFQFECKNPTIEARKVGVLWGLFRWASNQSRDFKHLPQSYEVMATMLDRVGLLTELEFLLSAEKARGVLLDSHEMFDNLIKGYASVSELEGAVSAYDRMRTYGLVPSAWCYHALLDLLVQANETELALWVYLDMVEREFKLTDAAVTAFHSVIKILCKDGKIQEARNVVRKVLPLGLKPSSPVLSFIASGYCKARAFEDLLSFYAEMNCAPDILTGNKIIYQLCNDFGIERADLFMQEMLHSGFHPDAMTFGILIGWSCREGKLRTALIYLSEILSRSLKPDTCSYTAIISGLFREGMWKHVQDIVHEMVDAGVLPNLPTYRVLLAGYCKARQFDEAKMMVGDMVNHGLIPPSSLEDPLTSAFLVVGLDPLAVRVKRDNDMGLSKTEFFDHLGNGLYLDADEDEYEKTLCRVLEDAMVVDFNLLVMQECSQGNLKSALSLVDLMAQWGQELSLPSLSALVKRFGASRNHMTKITALLEKVPESIYQLDEETLNLVVQAYSQQGCRYKGRTILKRMVQRHLVVRNETYGAVIMGLCKEANLRGLLDCWDIARKNKWLPTLKNFRVLVGFLCQKGRMKEALELFETMMASSPQLTSDFFCVFLEKLSLIGNTSIARVLVEQLPQGSILDPAVYSNLIRGFCKESRFSEAFMIYDIMVAKKLMPCLDVSIILVPHLCKADRFETAVSLEEACLRTQPLVSSSIYGAFVHQFCSAGRVGEAANVFRNMLSRGLAPDNEICGILVQGYCKVNNLRKVGELLGVIMRKNMSFSFSSYQKSVRLMCMEGKFHSALSLKEIMLRENNSSSIIIYNILIFYLLTTGNKLLVNLLLKELQDKEIVPDEATYNFLVYGFAHCDDVSSSLQCMKAMMSKGLRPSSRTLKIITRFLIDGGGLDRALELSCATELEGCVHGSIVQNAIVEGLLSCGMLDEAEGFLDRLAEKDLSPGNINYDNLIKCFVRYGRLSKGVDLLNIMLEKGNAPISSSYDSLVQGLCTHGKLDDALDLHTEMLYKDLKPSTHTWNVLADKLCENGRIAEAEGLLIYMVRKGEIPTKEMYHSVINRYRFVDNFSKASQLLQEMQRNGYEPDFETHWSLISKLRDSKEKDCGDSNGGFLSRLLSGCGFFQGKGTNKTKSR